jgi:predicted transposase YdaD
MLHFHQKVEMECVLTSLEVAEKKNSLSAAYMLITHIFEAKGQDNQDWLKRRWDIMSDELRNTWLYQQILKEGREEERKKWEAERQRELERWRQALISFVQAHFADQRLELQARGKATLINDPDVLQGLVLKIASAHTPEEAENYLLHWPQAS